MKIDAVIAWVDGGDPNHRAARARYSGEAANTDARFLQSGEIYIAIASILKYAPFIRRIFIVTDNQTPDQIAAFGSEALCERERIAIVSHNTIFEGLPVARPTFNSRVIESAIHRIPGLSEHFVYLNDDMLVNRPTEPTTFFAPDGRPVLAGDWQRPSHARVSKRLKHALRRILRRPDTRPSHQIGQETSAALLGYTKRFLRIPHRPNAMRVSTLNRVLTPDRLHRHVAHRFRHRSQFLPVSLAAHEELRIGAVPATTNDTAYLRDRMGADFEAKLAAIRDETTTFACIQNLESMQPAQRRRALSVLLDKFESHLPHAVKQMLAKSA